jgi:hypothetical protein
VVVRGFDFFSGVWFGRGVLRRLVIAAVAFCACAAPGNSIVGAVRGATLHPRSVLSFQLDRSPSFGGVQNGEPTDPPFTDLAIAIYDVGGGCELLETARPSSKPAALWLDFSSDAGVDPGRFSTGDSRDLTGLFWASGEDTCRFTEGSSATGTLDSTHGDVTGSFEVGFPGNDSLRGTFDATPCGAPPTPESQGMPGCW